MKNSRSRHLCLAFGATGLLALAGAAIHTGMTVAGSYPRTVTPRYVSGTTKPRVTWTPAMGMEPAAAG